MNDNLLAQTLMQQEKDQQDIKYFQGLKNKLSLLIENNQSNGNQVGAFQ